MSGAATMADATRDAREREYAESRRRAVVARAKVEISSRFDGSYERAVRDAKLADAQVQAHALALKNGPDTMVMPVAVRCCTSPAHSAASVVSEEDRLSGPLRGTALFSRNELDQAVYEQRAYAFSQTVRGMDLANGQQQRTSRYLEAVQFDLERNVRYAQQRYQEAARPRRKGPIPLDPGVMESMVP